MGTNAFNTVTLHRFRRVAKFLGLDEGWIEGEVRRQIGTALKVWPELVPTLLDEVRAQRFLSRLQALALVQETRM